MNYHNLTYPDMLNGDGLRVVLWLSGCSHHCYNCQNPQTWNPNGGILFDENAKKELYNELSKEYISGITFTGGDPLYIDNLNDVQKIICEISILFPDKNIWIYTGFTWKEMLPGTRLKGVSKDCLEHNKRNSIVEKCDVLVDGRYIDGLRDTTLKWRGSKNQKVINVQESIKNGEIVLWET